MYWLLRIAWRLVLTGHTAVAGLFLGARITNDGRDYIRQTRIFSNIKAGRTNSARKTIFLVPPNKLRFKLPLD